MNPFVGVAIFSALILVLAVFYPRHAVATDDAIVPASIWNVTVSMLMVKNEALIIERVVRSLHMHVGRLIFLCDTGSTDDTVAKAMQVAAEMPGADLIHYALPEGFKHFEQARNACRMALAKHNLQGVEWVALPDADFEAVSRPELASTPPAYDVCTIQLHATQPGMPHNSLHLLVRANAYFEHCRYRLWTHEYLDCSSSSNSDSPLTHGFYSGFHFMDHANGSSRSVKLTRDIQLLRGWLAQVNETELRPRALYYLARAYEDSGQTGLALHTYRRHEAEQTHTNYIFYGAYRVALIELGRWTQRCNANASECTGNSLAIVENAMLHAWRTYDGYFRREPFYQLAVLHRRLGNFHQCLLYAAAGLHLPPVDHQRIPLMIEPPMHGPLLESEYAYCIERLR